MLSIPEPQPAVHTFPDTGHSVRTVLRDGEPWWVAADVCAVLGYSRVADALRIPDADDLGTHFVRGQDGRERPAQIINEPGLYSLVFRSHRPEARAFKRWVTHEVLPAIRRTGRYEVARPEPTKLELARDLVVALEAQEAAEQRAAELEPSAAAWDTLAAEAVGDYSVREAAQLLSRDACIRTGQNRLFATLRELGWIDASGEPYQREVDAGRLVRRTLSYSHPHTGEPVLTSQVRVTPKGLAALRDRLGCGRQLPTAAPAA
ncbi:phage antirepressor [Streptomyces sp. NPDC007264]|uniref:phage antirepressor n=1 Tax=Streptomyces sp. NPDC007264 TaxID=3364777 RepID=UPI0036DA4D07